MQLTNEIICTQAGEGGTGVDGEGGTGVDGEGGTGVDGEGGTGVDGEGGTGVDGPGGGGRGGGVPMPSTGFHPSIRGWDTNLLREEGGRGSVA